jgi:hypothetical protein
MGFGAPWWEGPDHFSVGSREDAQVLPPTVLPHWGLWLNLTARDPGSAILGLLYDPDQVTIPF